MHEPADTDNDPPVVSSEATDVPQLTTLRTTTSGARGLSAETTTGLDDSDTATLAGSQGSQDIAEYALDGTRTGGAEPEEKPKTKGPDDACDSPSQDGVMPAVKRSTTTATTVTPRYTIHSPRMRWFIVGLVSLAGLMS